MSKGPERSQDKYVQDQAWYWTEAWQQDEKEAQQEIEKGMTSGTLAAEDALVWLEDDE